MNENEAMVQVTEVNDNAVEETKVDLPVHADGTGATESKGPSGAVIAGSVVGGALALGAVVVGGGKLIKKLGGQIKAKFPKKETEDKEDPNPEEVTEETSYEDKWQTAVDGMTAEDIAMVRHMFTIRMKEIKANETK